MKRPMKLTITAYYEADDSDYGLDGGDSRAMARIDQGAMDDDLTTAFDVVAHADDVHITVEPA